VYVDDMDVHVVDIDVHVDDIGVHLSLLDERETFSSISPT